MSELQQLTRHQQKALDFILDYMNEVGIPPSIREIGKAMNLSAQLSGGHRYIRILIRKGYLEPIMDPNAEDGDDDSRLSRGLRLSDAFVQELREAKANAEG